MSEQSRAKFEEAIARLVVPVENYWPRPWFTRHDLMTCSLLLVGASSAKTFRVEDLPNKDGFLDAHFNRNGLSCQRLYDQLAGSPSPTRRNIGRATDMLEAAGWRVMQTNVTCASAPFDRDISQPARKHGTEIFQAVVAHVPWRAMVVFGVGAAKRLGKTLRIDVPAQPISG